MRLMIRMAPLHFGQTRGSTFPAFAGTGSYFLNKSRPVSPEVFFIPLRLDDGGNGVIVAGYKATWRAVQKCPSARLAAQRNRLTFFKRLLSDIWF
jgi:hypothetical protein